MDSEICTKKYYVYNEVIAAIEIVRAYIQATRQVLVGGQSIDYALRLKGTQLYDDWEIPDLDFQSDDYANVAYEIFKKVATAITHIDVSVINALHHTTMRVQVAKFCVADITYISPRILKMYKKSALEYQGCLVRHPFFQYIDMQRSFSYPYENPMREVISNRWEKDHKRMLLTMQYYSPSDKAELEKFIGSYNSQPEVRLSWIGGAADRAKNAKNIKRKNNIAEILTLHKRLSEQSQPKRVLKGAIINGELAYLIYRCIYKKICGKKMPAAPINSRNEYPGSKYFFNSYLGVENKGDRFARQYQDCIGSRIIDGDFEYVETIQKTGYHTINLRKIDKSMPNCSVKVVTINYLAMYISMMWITLGTDMYLSLYIKLLQMIERVYNMPDAQLVRLMYPSIITTGEETPHPFEQHNLSFQKPENVYVNKYNPLSKALAQIVQYEYPDIYNMDGM